ncbi:MAG TPA: TonB-dependent receptor [bacterium]|nr:TonB-dependent receptor [bacterium]
MPTPLVPRNSIFSALAALVMLATASQAVTLEGRVTAEATAEPLRLANVYAKNTLHRTVTDDDGRFELEVDALPAIIVVRYIGFQSAEIEIGAPEFLEIALATSRGETEEVLVVGSRFQPRTAITSPVPIDNVTSDQLESTGHLTFDKMLMYAVPAFNSSQQTISDATAHFDPADLRGLGPSRTLVLINGKRKNASSLVYINDTPGKGEVGVDLKSIPAAAIERIEVLRDGASAQYGSDAIAGVINIVLKDDYDVTTVRGWGGATTEGDGEMGGYDVNTGLQLGPSGFLHLTHSYSDRDETNRAGEPGEDTLFGVAASDPWIQENPDLGMHVGLPNMTTSEVFFNGGYTLPSNAEIYSFGGVVFRKGLSYALYRAPYWIPDPDFIYHDSGETYQGFQPTFETDIVDNTLFFGVRGQTQGWDYDVSQGFGSNTVDYTVDNSLNTDLGAQSPTFFETGGYEFSSRVTNLDLSRQVAQAQVSVGTEFRTENFVANAGEPDSYFGSGTQSFPGLQPQNEVDANRNNIGVYADVAVDLTDDVLVGGAARFENYDDFGDAFTWKANGRFKFWDDRATLRGSAQTGFRAPSLHQIHLSIVQTLVSGGTVSNQGTFDNGSPVLRALRVAPLKEEESQGFTVGAALRPTDATFLSLDVYRVDVDDRIVYSSSIAAADSTTAVGQILAANSITSLKFFTNAVDTRTEGIDFVGTHHIEVGAGDVGFTVSANFNDTEIRGNITTPDPIAAEGVDIFDRKEQSRILSARPDSKVLVGVSYEQGPFEGTVNNTRFGEVMWQHATDPTLDQTFEAKVVTDLHLRYRINSFVSIGATVLNLFDVYPDEIEAGSDVLTDLGGRFRYPWEVNQFGFAGTTASGSLVLTF